jgi:hypothetical protein
MQRLSPATIVLIALAALAFIGLIYVYATKDGGNQDALSDDEVATAQSPAEAQAQDLCSDSGTYALIKEDLLRRAAALRSPELDSLGELAGAASFRVENPVLESDGEQGGVVRCSGSLSIALPPGVAAAGNRTSLTGNVDYELRGGRLALAGADAMVSALASVARVELPEHPLGDADLNAIASDPLAPLEPGAPPPPAPAVQPRANPSFNCDDASTRGEIAVCSDPGLAALDRTMAAQYRRAIGSATPAQRALLNRTRDRFLGFRDNCQTRGCMSDAYNGRMREIRDIMEGRWQPQR